MDGKVLLAASCLATVTATGVGARTAHEQLPQKGQDSQLELAVLVYSESEVPWLSAAQVIAAGLFEDAGVRLAWISCGSDSPPAACARPPAGNEIAVRIRRARVDPASHGCGVALQGFYITLFLDCIAEGSEVFRTREAVVGAFCLAHEIAHLLLPAGHASSGIMQPRLRPIDWERAARGGLRFNRAEQRQMAEALRRRLLEVTGDAGKSSRLRLLLLDDPTPPGYRFSITTSNSFEPTVKAARRKPSFAAPSISLPRVPMRNVESTR
jgi:hypothetical protein